MTIDIILFCYRQEQYIQQALESILVQDLPVDARVRLIVADDHSPDNTLGIIRETRSEKRELSDRFEWVFLPEEANMGISKNYKRSFAATEGEYVFILEGDDYWLPGHVMQHINAYEQNIMCSMIMSRISALHCTDGRDTQIISGMWNYKDEVMEVDVHKQIAQGNQLGNLSACSFRGDKIRSFPESLFEMSVADWMFGIEIAQNGPILLLKDSTSVYRVSNMGVWAGNCPLKNWWSMWAATYTFNDFHNGKYEKDWVEFRKFLIRDLKQNWMHYMPRWIMIFNKSRKQWIQKL